jgi:hypothetical protein
MEVLFKYGRVLNTKIFGIFLYKTSQDKNPQKAKMLERIRSASNVDPTPGSGVRTDFSNNDANLQGTYFKLLKTQKTDNFVLSEGLN